MVETMSQLSRNAVIALLLSAAALHGQLSGLLGKSETAAAAPSEPQDTLGRSTPRGALVGFLRAAQSGKFGLATQFLQIPEDMRDRKEGRELARELNAIMSQSFHGDLDRISNAPEGSQGDSLPPDREAAGSLNADRTETLILLRVEEKTGVPIWLISAGTIARVPALYKEVGYPEIESVLPEALVRIEVLSIPLWRWLAAILLIPVSVGVAWLLLKLLVLPMSALAAWRRKTPGANFWKETSTPLLVILTMIVHSSLILAIGIPPLYRQYYARLVQISITCGVGWLLSRWVQHAAKRASALAASRGLTAAGSMLIMGRRILETVLAIAVLLTALRILGFEITGVLAGLGIGGIAVALAAQKTLENFFGGVSLLSDQVIRVGDFCRFGDQRGTVEDIGLRSTAVRTLDRTLLSIPNGMLAAMPIENFAHRDKIWFNPVIGLRYETTPAQLRKLIDDMREMLAKDPRIEDKSLGVRFVQFAASSLNVEVFAYVLTRDWTEFCTIREELLLRIMDLVEAVGTGMAFPSQTLYLAKETPPRE